MADDWIKVRTDLPDDPNVFIIAEALSLECPPVVGLLVTFWGWMDRHTADGFLRNLSEHVIDKKLSTPGFSAALRKVGWLEGENGALCLPKFERHNGASAKARALESEAKRIRRAAEKESNQAFADAAAAQGLLPATAIPGRRAGAENVGHKSDNTANLCRTREEKSREEEIREEGISNTRSRVPSFRQQELPADWTPPPDALAVLNQAGVPQDFIEGLHLREFRLYWRERQELRTPKAWVTTFSKFIVARFNEAGGSAQLPLPPRTHRRRT